MQRLPHIVLLSATLSPFTRSKKGKKEIESFDISHAGSFQHLPDISRIDASAAGSVHLMKPSGGSKGLINPPCHIGLACFLLIKTRNKKRHKE